MFSVKDSKCGESFTVVEEVLRSPSSEKAPVQSVDDLRADAMRPKGPADLRGFERVYSSSEGGESKEHWILQFISNIKTSKSSASLERHVFSADEDG